MKVIISVHFDLAHLVPYIAMNDGKLHGLVDNFAGVFTVYSASRTTNVPVYFTNQEETDYTGAIEVAEILPKDTFVIVVDTIKQSDIQGAVASITNVYHFDTSLLKRLFTSRIHFIDGFFEETEDETYIYGKKFGLKTMYFGVPIPHDYHATDNTCDLRTVDVASKILEEVIIALQRS